MTLIEKILNESAAGGTLCVVDIQPGHLRAFSDTFTVSGFCRYMNYFNGKILYIHNDKKAGFEDKNTIAKWLIINGLNKDKLSSITFLGKDYGFFREFTDDYGRPKDFISLVKYMIDNNIQDSKNIDLTKVKFKSKKVNEFLQGGEFSHNEGHITIPAIAKTLASFSSDYTVCGGARNECLLEIVILLEALNKSYTLLNEFVY